MKKKEKKPLNEVSTFYVQQHAKKNTAEEIAKVIGCNVDDILILYNDFKNKSSTQYQVHSGTVAMTEKQGVSDDKAAKEDNTNHEFLEKYKNTRHKL